MISEKRFRRTEVRADGSGRFISGYASVFGVTTDIAGMFLEQVKPGAFARAIGEKQDVRALYNHSSSAGVLGRVSNGSLTLKEDSRGLSFRCDVARTTLGDDVLSMIRRGDVSECSFGFSCTRDTWTKARDGSANLRDLRTIEDVDLFDVSCVVFPAYGRTNVDADERSRVVSQFPMGAPEHAPRELRNRLDTIALPFSEEEWQLRARARQQLLNLEVLS